MILPPDSSTQYVIGGNAKASDSQHVPNFGTSEGANRDIGSSSLGLLLTSSQQTSPSTPQFTTSTPSGGPDHQQDFMFLGLDHSTAGQQQTTSPQTVYASDYRSNTDGIYEISRHNSISSSVDNLMSPMSVFNSSPTYHSYQSYPPITSSDGTGATSLPSSLASFSTLSHTSHPSMSLENNFITHTSSGTGNATSIPMNMYPSSENSQGKLHLHGNLEYNSNFTPNQLKSPANISGSRMRASSDIVTSHRQGTLSYHTTSSSYGGTGRSGAGGGLISSQSIPEEAERSETSLEVRGKREDPPLPMQNRDISYAGKDTEMQ
jgi:hypothetical protein